MDGVLYRGGHLHPDVVGHRLGVGCEQLLQADQGRGTEAKLEQLGDRARHLAETDPDVIVQIDGDGADRFDHRCPGFRSDFCTNTIGSGPYAT